MQEGNVYVCCPACKHRTTNGSAVSNMQKHIQKWHLFRTDRWRCRVKGCLRSEPFHTSGDLRSHTTLHNTEEGAFYCPRGCGKRHRRNGDAVRACCLAAAV